MEHSKRQPSKESFVVKTKKPSEKSLHAKMESTEPVIRLVSTSGWFFRDGNNSETSNDFKQTQ